MTIEQVPERTLDQRHEALLKANLVRTERAGLKKRMKARKESPLDLILEPPDYIETMKVESFLLAVPKYGKVKSRNVLKMSRISPSKTVGGMSLRQRTELVQRMQG